MLPMKNLYQDIDWDLPLDLKLQQGTPIVPNKPAVAVWLRHPGEQATGILATLDIDLMPICCSPRTTNRRRASPS